VKINTIKNVVAEQLEADPSAGSGVSMRRYAMGGHRTLDHAMVEIAVGGHVREHRNLAEEAMLILQGTGRTRLRSDDGREATVEWAAGDLVSAPLQVWREHTQTGTEPVRYFVVKNNFIERALGVKGNRSLDGVFPDRYPNVLEADRSAFLEAAAKATA